MNRPEYLDYRLDGLNLIEAAAGTGKTYTIQNLAVRFLLERRIPIQSLLVVTFTEAAAGELKERVRQILTAMLRAADGEPEPEERCRLLLESAERAGTSLLECRQLLRMALLRFDEAPISTIHAFCGRILNENAFESGVLFKSKLLKDPSEMLAGLGMDFYRKTFYADSEDAELRAAAAEALKITPVSLLELVRLQTSHKHLKINAPGLSPDPAAHLRQIDAALAEIRQGDLPSALQKAAPVLNKLDDLAAADAPGFVAALLAATGPGAASELLLNLPRFGYAALLPKIRKRIKGMTPEEAAALLDQPEFHAAYRLGAAIRDYGGALQLAAAHEVAAAFRRRKAAENVMTFDDLLQQVYDALARPESPLLPRLRERYPVGIVDEFQDTDPVQYEIFTLLFRHPGGTLYMVGDPRQAIYAFRGGDIATYRRALRELDAAAGERYSLLHNYRSAAPMIADVNLLFHHHPMPFADREIRFPAVIAPLDSTGQPRPGLRVTAADGEHEEEHPLRIVHAPDCRDEACRALTVDRIRALLADRSVRLPERAETGLRPGDIAVLVLRGYEAEALAGELAGHGIPAVFTRMGTVFESDDALELLFALRAAAGSDARGLPDLLATPLGGATPAELSRLQTPAGEERLIREQETFRRLQLLWQRESFISFFQAMLTAYRVKERYPLLRRGERKLTNLLQLGDLLQEEQSRRGLNPAGLVDWLASRIADPATASTEEYQQLLETDREAVKLMTVHGSKGLEFPVVLLPDLFLGDPVKKAKLYHNDAEELEFDLGGDPANRLRAAGEGLQELLRLAYVAITRAKYRCYVFYGKGAGASPLDWLLRMRRFDPAAIEAVDQEADTSPLAWLRTHAGECEIPPELIEDADSAPPADAGPDAAPPLRLECPALRLAIDPHWQYVSFSGLQPQPRPGGDAPYDYDETDRPGADESSEESELPIFTLRGGAATGNAWHRLFEEIDFGASRQEIRDAALPLLREYGLIEADEDPAAKLDLTVEMVRNVLRTPLSDDAGNRFRLDTVGPRDRLIELEFSYEFRRGFTTADLRDLLTPYVRDRLGFDQWPVWERAISGGCLNGFIDLFFRTGGRYYLLDWKSNRLDGRLASFQPEHLHHAMCHSFYFLQYLIYTVAAVKYLRLRLGGFGPEEYHRDFGGVFYLFLRGVSPQHPGRGVFYDKPPYELIMQLENCLG